MTDTFGAMLEAKALKEYRQDIARIEKMEPAEQRAAAVQIIKRLARLRFHLDYRNEDHAQRFERLWCLAFPNESDERLKT